MEPLRKLAICMMIFSLFMLAVISFSQKQANTISKYHQDREALGLFQRLNK